MRGLLAGAVVMLLINLGVLLWLHTRPLPAPQREVRYDLGPGERPAPSRPQQPAEPSEAPPPP